MCWSDPPLPRQPRELLIASNSTFGDVELINDDVLFNVLTANTVLKRKVDGIPWRGSKEKSDNLLRLLVTSLYLSGSIIADLTMGTGESF